MTKDKDVRNAKKALDTVIKKARIHGYKPIQIAEILYRSRTVQDIDASELEDYRTSSRVWRDRVSLKLVGNVSTSSARFQDNLFDTNAVPPTKLTTLDKVNKSDDGIVENYVYHRLMDKWRLLTDVHEYLNKARPGDFSLHEVLSHFTTEPGLKKSVDKIYEVVAYALFRILTKILQVEVSISVTQSDDELLTDFSDFLERVVGISSAKQESAFMADLYRVGVSHAADAGIDMWTDFGVAVQVKHVTLNAELAKEIVRPLETNRIVIVCLEPEKATIEAIVKQVGVENRIQGVVTDKDLESWYALSLSKYRDRIGSNLLKELLFQFSREFPQPVKIRLFLEERGYVRSNLKGIWSIAEQRRI